MSTEKCICSGCGREVVRIQTMVGPTLCWAAPTPYWPVRDNDARELITPDGKSVYGNLTGEDTIPAGEAHLPHSCHIIPLVFKGRDSWSRPVYMAQSGLLFVDVEPRADREPVLCTKVGNRFDGEPDVHMKRDLFPDFIPKRDTWY